MENDEEVVDMCKAWSDMAAEERESVKKKVRQKAKGRANSVL